MLVSRDTLKDVLCQCVDRNPLWWSVGAVSSIRTPEWRNVPCFPTTRGTGIFSECPGHRAARYVVHVWCCLENFWIHKQRYEFDAPKPLLGLNCWTWSNYKSHVYWTPVEIPKDLIAWIAVAAADINSAPAIFEHIRNRFHAVLDCVLTSSVAASYNPCNNSIHIITIFSFPPLCCEILSNTYLFVVIVLFVQRDIRIWIYIFAIVTE